MKPKKKKKVIFDESEKQVFDTLRKAATVLLSAFARAEVSQLKRLCLRLCRGCTCLGELLRLLLLAFGLKSPHFTAPSPNGEVTLCSCT